MLQQFSKSDIVHGIMGGVSLLIWLFGEKLSFPIEAIQYAHTAVIALCGSAFGIAVATDNPTPQKQVLPLPGQASFTTTGE